MKGRIWIGSLEGGIHVFDPLSQKQSTLVRIQTVEKLQDNQF
jgi:hypothetical protein